MPEFTVHVSPFVRENSNIRGLARVYFEDSFVVNNITILQGKEKVFVAMPSYNTKQTSEDGRSVYKQLFLFDLGKLYKPTYILKMVGLYFEIKKTPLIIKKYEKS